MSGFAQLTETSHYRCYGRTEVIELAGKRKSGMPLAEISLARCDDGWRASHGFGFNGGDHWGSWSPVFASSPAHPTREAAILAEAGRLREHIVSRTGPEPERIRRWLDGIVPEQADMFA